MTAFADPDGFERAISVPTAQSLRVDPEHLCRLANLKQLRLLRHIPLDKLHNIIHNWLGI